MRSRESVEAGSVLWLRRASNGRADADSGIMQLIRGTLAPISRSVHCEPSRLSLVWAISLKVSPPRSSGFSLTQRTPAGFGWYSFQLIAARFVGAACRHNLCNCSAVRLYFHDYGRRYNKRLKPRYRLMSFFTGVNHDSANPLFLSQRSRRLWRRPGCAGAKWSPVTVVTLTSSVPTKTARRPSSETRRAASGGRRRMLTNKSRPIHGFRGRDQPYCGNLGYQWRRRRCHLFRDNHRFQFHRQCLRVRERHFLRRRDNHLDSGVGGVSGSVVFTNSGRQRYAGAFDACTQHRDSSSIMRPLTINEQTNSSVAGHNELTVQGARTFLVRRRV